MTTHDEVCAHDDHRESLGRRVREVWIAWAERQDNPKPSWLVPWDELDEATKEVDRCLGSALWGDGFNDGFEQGLRIKAALDVDGLTGAERDQAVDLVWGQQGDDG